MQRVAVVELGDRLAARVDERDHARDHAADEGDEDEHPHDAPVQRTVDLDYQQVHRPTSSSVVSVARRGRRLR